MAAPRFMDDIARLVTDATGAAQGVRREAESLVRGQVERFLRDMDVATREEVDVLKDMLGGLRAENARLAARVAALEGASAAPDAAAAATGDGPAQTIG